MCRASGVCGVTAVAAQVYRGRTPVELGAYWLIYSVILIPSVAFITAWAVLLNVILRDKYLAYAASVATGAVLFYLYSRGYNHWLYNPVLYQLWTYTDLTGAGGKRALILVHRVYWLANACACLSLAHACFGRKSAEGLRGGVAGRSMLLLAASIAVALAAGFAVLSLSR